jgi:tetratricopeptide (TPR) repeat protein
MMRPRPRRAVVPGIAAALLAAAIALLQLEQLPSWLAWCPPWLAAGGSAGLGVCVVAVDRWRARRHAEADRDQAAIDRLRQHTGRQKTVFPRIGEAPATALALRVHTAAGSPHAPVVGISPARWRRLLPRHSAQHEMDGVDADLPLFVDRAKGPQIRRWMRSARTSGGFLLLIGDSCVGKTRLLYEAARQELADFAVLAPDLGDGDLVNTIAEATFDMPKLIVWLDELQRFLPGPYLTDGATPITAATIRRLLDAPTPVIVVGTLWPRYAETLRAIDVDNERQPRYPGAVDILTDRRVHETRIDTFTREERVDAARVAAHDPRLGAAVADRDYNVTEALAGARELIDRYERATTTQRAVLHAAVDARRVGIQSPLTEDLLREAGRGYLSTPHRDDTWFRLALDELTSHQRPQDRATAPLRAEPGPDQRTVIGYTITDYLLQHLTRQRRTEPIPTLTWEAFSQHTHAHDDLNRLASSACCRLRYDQAIPIYQRLHEAGDPDADSMLLSALREQGNTAELRSRADSGDAHAAMLLADLLVAQGNTAEIRSRADSGDTRAAYRLADLLVSEGRTDELRGWADSAHEVATDRLTPPRTEPGRVDGLPGHKVAAMRLTDLLIKQGRIDEVRERADAGDRHAAMCLSMLWRDQGRSDELLERADAGDDHAAIGLVELLTEQDRVNEAIDILRRWVDAGWGFAIWYLANLLAEQGNVDEAIDLLRRADTGRRYAGQLAELLAGQGNVDEAIDRLTGAADAGDESAIKFLAKLLGTQNRAGEELDAGQSARLLAAQDRVDEAIDILNSAVDAGDELASWSLARLLVFQNRVDELRARADAGDRRAAHSLVDFLREQGRTDELRDRADTGDSNAAEQLAELLVEQGHTDELRERADTGDSKAAEQLAELLVEQGRTDELRERADTGDSKAAEQLAELLVEQGHTDELRDRADAGDRYAIDHLACLLPGLTPVDEAIDILRRWAETGNEIAVGRLAWLLVELDDEDVAIDLFRGWVEAGIGSADSQLARLLRWDGRIDELLAEVYAGTYGAAGNWVAMLVEQGQAELVERILRRGLTPELAADDFLR